MSKAKNSLVSKVRIVRWANSLKATAKKCGVDVQVDHAYNVFLFGEKDKLETALGVLKAMRRVTRGRILNINDELSYMFVI